MDISKSLVSRSSPELDSTFRLYGTGVLVGVAGTLHVLKRSSLVGSLLGGLFSFSKKKAICIRTEERTPPCYLAVLLTSRKVPGDLGWKERATGQTIFKGKEETGQATTQTLSQMWGGERHEQSILTAQVFFNPRLCHHCWCCQLSPKHDQNLTTSN